jgi:hypothetical protein
MHCSRLQLNACCRSRRTNLPTAWQPAQSSLLLSLKACPPTAPTTHCRAPASLEASLANHERRCLNENVQEGDGEWGRDREPKIQWNTGCKWPDPSKGRGEKKSVEYDSMAGVVPWEFLVVSSLSSLRVTGLLGGRRRIGLKVGKVRAKRGIVRGCQD